MIFNRPDLTEHVFAAIAEARPRKLLVIADGPRPERAGEAEKCAAARAIVERVDWECDVLKNYSDINMGCARRPATGLRWVFEQVEEAIILEDDCVPHPTFFPFCEELLEKYRNDKRVMHISGNNFFFRQESMPFSYFFSRYCLSWGWATWRRAFQYYDPEIKLWPSVRNNSWLLDILGDPRAVDHWKNVYDLTLASMDNVNTWDFQWVFACWVQGGLSILPSANLVSNIGFRGDATHTKRMEDKCANFATTEMIFPLTHPACMMRDREIDELIFNQVVLPPQPQPNLYARLRQKCAATLPTPLRKSISSLRSRLSSSYSN